MAKQRAKEYQRVQPPDAEKIVYVLVTPEGNLRIGSTGNAKQRLKVHKRRGWRVLHIFSRGMSDPTKRFATERKQSRFYAMQAREEPFEVVNRDY